VDRIGQTLGQYRIIEQIGQGGMATVYRAYQPSLDRYVAIKILPPYFAHEPGFAMRFTREARAVARLNHPNILPIYDFGQEQDLSYIVMKCVEAGTLKQILGAPLALDVTADIVQQVAAALDHAHQRGILHRDVKPSNVLLDEGGWVLLTDFGLAKMVEGSAVLTASGVGVGTPAYMAPEQGRGEAVDARADIYSLGIVLYEMLTGRVPFEAETPMAVVIKHITDPLPLPRSINPDLPDAIERVVLKALAKSPDDRFGSTTEMADALASVVSAGAPPAPETAEPALAPPPPAVPSPVLSPVERPAPAVEPVSEKPVSTPKPPAVEVPAPARRGVPWKILGAIAGIVVLALAAVFVAGKLGRDGGAATPTTAAAILANTATATRPVPTWTPKQEPTATRLPPVQEPTRPSDEQQGTEPPLPPHLTEMELYDDFDQGFLDNERWEWRPAADSDVVEIDDRGVLVIQIENPDPEPHHGDLIARIHRPIAEVQADLIVEHLKGEHTDLVISLFAAGRPLAGIMGEQANVIAFEEEGDVRLLSAGGGLPAQHHLHLVLTPEDEMHVIVDGHEVGTVPAPPAAEGFSIGYRIDPGGSLVGLVDNVQVRYLDGAAMPGEPVSEVRFHCEDELGCVDIPPGDPIHIAYMLDQSGDARSVGIDSIRGVEIAIGQKGEILGHPIELTGQDSACNPEIGQEVAPRIAEDPAVVAVVGTTCSSTAVVVAPIISQAGLVMISPSNTKFLLTDPRVHQPGYLRVAPNDGVQARAAAEFARSLLPDARTAATLYEDDLSSAPLQQLFARAFKELGGEITVQEQISPDDSHVRSTLAFVARTKPDLIFCPLLVEVGGLVTRLARETPGLEETILLGTDGMFAPELLKIAGPAAVGLYLSSPDLSIAGDRYQAFLAQYRDRYGESPQSLFHAHAYDAAAMILAAIEQVAVLDEEGGLHVGRQALRDALFATRDFDGLTGILTCTPRGDCADTRVSVYQVVSADPDAWNPSGDNPRKVWP